MCFPGKENGIYFRVDSVDPETRLAEVEKAVREASVIQCIIFFFLKEYIDK